MKARANPKSPAKSADFTGPQPQSRRQARPSQPAPIMNDRIEMSEKSEKSPPCASIPPSASTSRSKSPLTSSPTKSMRISRMLKRIDPTAAITK